MIEILSECVEFFEGAFDGASPRKGGAWTLIEEKKNDGTPEDIACSRILSLILFREYRCWCLVRHFLEID